MTLFRRSDVGSVSPSAMPDCAGLVPVFVSVKTSVVAAPSLIAAAPKVLATVGGTAFTTRQTSAMPVVATRVRPPMSAAPLVKFTAGHVGFEGLRGIGDTRDRDGAARGARWPSRGR